MQTVPVDEIGVTGRMAVLMNQMADKELGLKTQCDG